MRNLKKKKINSVAKMADTSTIETGVFTIQKNKQKNTLMEIKLNGIILKMQILTANSEKLL